MDIPLHEPRSSALFWNSSTPSTTSSRNNIAPSTTKATAGMDRLGWGCVSQRLLPHIIIVHPIRSWRDFRGQNALPCRDRRPSLPLLSPLFWNTSTPSTTSSRNNSAPSTTKATAGMFRLGGACVSRVLRLVVSEGGEEEGEGISRQHSTLLLHSSH
ncbi:hypothetical protein JZ751_004281 [Albula glossodonta]|uniref:Uncharacterized protein n=1 Tax=Albula glossodonta TaxID=121402 RepID=A0A8T2MQS6_9TELE|nr:hypothetical protein JZ751_004281 [Albula glossodonta]